MASMAARGVGGVPGRVQALALRAATALLLRLGPVASSNLGGWLARTLGPRLRVSRVADSNLRRAMPELGAAERARVVRAVWDNVGRTVAELPHLPGFRETAEGPGWEIEGYEHVAGLQGKQLIYVSGHLGNWEMMLPIAAQRGFPTSGMYRAPSNAGVDAFLREMRGAALGAGVPMFPKGAAGARAALKHMAGGGLLGLLMDQKMNDGVAVPFFGRPAMTAPALAQFALRFKCPVVPAHIVRLGPARFRMVVDPPLDVPLTGRREADVHAILLAVNQTLERWIRADPGSWLWLHRRWPKEEAQ